MARARGIPIQKISMDKAVHVVEKALNLGVNYIDTARAYIDSEEKIEGATQGRRDECYLATKTNKRARDEVKRDLEMSLKMLGTSKVDVHQLHNVSDEETLEKVLAPRGARAFLQPVGEVHEETGNNARGNHQQRAIPNVEEAGRKGKEKRRGKEKLEEPAAPSGLMNPQTSKEAEFLGCAN